MKEKSHLAIRDQVAERAGYRCEYCRIKEEDSFLRFHIDHIISQKHGGGNELENLAYCCPHCNQHKGTDITTFVDTYDNLVPLFNPRKEDWFQHFRMVEGEIVALTEIGKATVKLLQLNNAERLIIREILQEVGALP